MTNSEDRIFARLYAICDDQKGRGASHKDCLEAGRELYAHLIAVASFEDEDTLEALDHRIAVAKEKLEVTIRMHALTLDRLQRDDA